MDTDKRAKLRALIDATDESDSVLVDKDVVKAMLDVCEAAKAVDTYDGYVGCAPWESLSTALAALAEKIK